MVKRIAIDAAALEIVVSHALRAFPAECCGWIAGLKDGVATTARPCDNAQASAAHETTQDRTAETAYVIAGADLLELNRSIDGASPPLVIYHSHPNGRAYFSSTDQQVATSPWGDGPMYPVQQLVVGVDATGPVEAAQFAWDDTTGGFVEVARWPLRPAP